LNEGATLKGLRHRSAIAPAATPSELRRILRGISNPGFQGKPWAEISERFQRYVFEINLLSA
jgi:hypothetical protein